MTDTTDTTPAQQLAALIGDTNARTAIQAGWDAIRHHDTTEAVPSPFLDNYVARILLAALTALNTADHAEEQP